MAQENCYVIATGYITAEDSETLECEIDSKIGPKLILAPKHFVVFGFDAGKHLCGVTKPDY